MSRIFRSFANALRVGAEARAHSGTVLSASELEKQREYEANLRAAEELKKHDPISPGEKPKVKADIPVSQEKDGTPNSSASLKISAAQEEQAREQYKADLRAAEIARLVGQDSSPAHKK